LSFKTASTIGFLVLAACGPVPPKEVRVQPPPVPIVPPNPEPIPSVLGKTLQSKPQVDQIGLVIVEARIRAEHGEQLYRDGFLKQAKEEFDNAIDLLLDSASLYPKNPRLEREITELVGKVHALEIVAFKDGDGFRDHRQEHAAIDDLEQITTFPTPIDPKFKKEVEDEVAEIRHDLPIEINDRVLNFLDYYQNGHGRTFIELGLERVGKYQPMIEQILQEEGVPQDLIYVCYAESAFVPRAVSRAHAKGMWQFISARGKEYGLRQNWWIDERSDPEKSTRAAARHLKDLFREFGDWYLAMAAYNAGPMRVQKAIERTGDNDFWNLANKRALPKETINYVPTILALSIIGKNPEKYGFNVVTAPPLETDRVNVDKPTDLRVIAESIHVSAEDLKELNPHILRWTTPPDDPEFQLVLPKGLAETFRDQITGLPENKRVLFRYHTVQRAETLSTVARKYRATVAELAEANNLSTRKPLRTGQELIIPMSGVGPAPSVVRTTVDSVVNSYTVRRGDTLSTIASKFHATGAQIRQWNHLPSQRLIAGRKLIVAAPHPTVSASADTVSERKIIHKVRPGETLNQIAVAYKTTVGAILSWNKENDLTVIHPGDQITIFLGNH